MKQLSKSQLDIVKSVLDNDPLAEAEKVTGKHHSDEFTGMLGLHMALTHNRSKEKLLSSIDDTLFSNKVQDYLRKIARIGFEVIYKESFIGSSKESPNETFYVLFCKELGILLEFDTYGGDCVNGGSFIYNWQPANMFESSRCTSSGSYYFKDRNPNVRNDGGHLPLFNEAGEELVIADYPDSTRRNVNENEPWEDYKKRSAPVEAEQMRLKQEAFADGFWPIWVGNHDCREGVITNIMRMQHYGRFMPIWKELPTTFWLTHYAENKGDKFDYNAATKKRVDQFPEEVRKQIGWK